uniref:Uncharacterized protein n=1 Tax=Nicotiana tabacum TaxID=4097 RepID=A0A1S3XMN9_TOBAC|nr:PREDICTED: uncharacterized protein LOC107766869 [Nicotiana tabacum]
MMRVGMILLKKVMKKSLKRKRSSPLALQLSQILERRVVLRKMFLQPRYLLLMAQLQLRRKTSQVMSLVLRMIAAQRRRRMPLIRHMLLHLKMVLPLPLKRKNPATSLVQMMIPLALQLSQRRRVVLRNLLMKTSPLKKKRMKNHRELPRSKRPLLLLKLKLRDQK